MAWTYDGTLDTNGEKVRLLIGDTDTNDQQLTDAEISYFLTEAGSNIRLAAILSVEALIAKYARQVDTSIGDLRVGASKKVANYEALLTRLRMRQLTEATPWAGGQTIADKQTYEEDTDLVTPQMFRDLHMHPETLIPEAQTEDRDV